MFLLGDAEPRFRNTTIPFVLYCIISSLYTEFTFNKPFIHTIQRTYSGSIFLHELLLWQFRFYVKYKNVLYIKKLFQSRNV